MASEGVPSRSMEKLDASMSLKTEPACVWPQIVAPPTIKFHYPPSSKIKIIFNFCQIFLRIFFEKKSAYDLIVAGATICKPTGERVRGHA